MEKYVLPRARMEILAYLELHQYSSCTFKSSRIALDNIEMFFRNNDVIHYDSKTMKSFRAFVETRRREHDLGVNFYHTFIRISHYVDNCYNGRLLTMIPSSEEESIDICDSPVFEEIEPCRYKSFVEEFLDTTDYGPIVKDRARHILYLYMSFLEDDGWSPLFNITIDQMANFMIAQRDHYSVLKKWMAYIKSFMIFMEERDMAESIPSSFLYMKGKGSRTVLPCFSYDDITRIFQAIDRDTKLGKLEYAIIVAALYTGLRGVDVRNLEVDDLDFDNHELKICQRKTKAIISQPMLPLLEDALLDYLLNSRPASNSRHVFLYEDGGEIDYPGVLLNTILKRAGIASGMNLGHTFHAFRRCLALWLIESEVAPEMITMILGHQDRRVFRRYIPLSLNNLSQCCLSMADIPCTKEAFYEPL